MRVGLVGGNGKTGQAVVAALDRRGHASVALGRAEWTDLGGALRGCDAAYLIAPNFHPDEPGYIVTVAKAGYRLLSP